METNPTPDLDQSLSLLSDLLDAADRPDIEKAKPDWEAEDGALELVPSIFVLHQYDRDGDLTVPVIGCGSVGFADTPKTLYRLLYLFSRQGGRWPIGGIASRPGHRDWNIDFGDMYKSCSLFAIVSPDYQFVADPQFFKYEIAIYFRASREHVSGKLHGVIAGAPGSDNGIRPSSDLLSRWQTLLVRLLSRKWRVYSGNEFYV